MPVDREKASRWAAKPGVLVTLTPVERQLIREALSAYRTMYVLDPGEEEIFQNLLRRIPDPRG
jgi:hypothetical protein